MRAIPSAFFAILAVLSITIPFPSMAGSILKPEEIFKYHAQAVGYSASDGSGKPYIETMKVTWIDYIKHSHEGRVVRHQAGPFYREDRTLFGATTSQGFGEGDFWFSTSNDNVTGDIGLGRKLRVTWAVINAEAYDATVHPQARGENLADDVVRIQPDSGMIADVYFNRDSWLIDRVIIDPEHFGFRVDYSDYKRQGPVTIAMTQRRGVNEMRVADFDSYSVTDFQWDASFSADEFAAPTPKPYTTLPASGRSSIPFDFHGGIVVEGKINGAFGRFLLDPGENRMMITSGMAAKAHIIDKYAPVQWIGDIIDNPRLTISLGDVEFKDVRVGILDGNYLGLYDGVFGYDAFAQTVVDVDFPRRIVTFSDASAFKATSDRHGLPLVFSDGIAQVMVTANHSAPMLLEVRPTGVGQLAVWQGVYSDSAITSKIGLSNGYIGDLDIGPHSVEHVRVDPTFLFYDVWTSLTGSMGLIEGGILKDFDVTFDYPKSIVYIDPDTNP